MKCKECIYCKSWSRTEKQYDMPIGRKIYACEHPDLKQINSFIGYGNMTIESPLQLKTQKRFCPLKKEIVKEVDYENIKK